MVATNERTLNNQLVAQTIPHDRYERVPSVGYSIAFTARVNNLLKACENQSQSARIVLVRDARLDNYTPTMRTALEALRTAGHAFVEVDQEQHSSLMAMHDCLVAVEEGDLNVAGLILGREHFRPYLQDRVSAGVNSPLKMLTSCDKSEADNSTDEQLLLALDVF